MSRAVVVRGDELDLATLRDQMLSVGPCAVKISRDGAVVEFGTVRQATAAACAFNNTKVGGSYVSVSVVGERSAHSRPSLTRNMFSAIIVTDDGPLCRINTFRDVSPTLRVVSIAESPNIEGFARSQAFAMFGATAEDTRILRAYTGKFSIKSACAVAISSDNSVFVYIFPSDLQLASLWGVSAEGAAIAVIL